MQSYQYSALRQAIQQQKSLSPYLYDFHQTLVQSNKRPQHLVLKNMNDQQVLAQIYQNMKKTMKKINVQFKKIDGDPQQLEESQQQQMEMENNYQQNQEDNQMEEEMGEQEQDENQNQLANQQPIQQLAEQEQQSKNEQFNDEQEEYQDEDDVGLYGEKLDNQQEMEEYEHEFDEQQDPQFQRFKKQVNKKDKNVELDEQQQQVDAEDQNIEDNFDQFRQIQLQNQENDPEKDELQQKIKELQNRIEKKKDWVMLGQVKARERPVNSLLQYDLQFKTGVKFSREITQQANQELEGVIKQRILDQLFDDRTRYMNSNALREHFGSLQKISTQKSKKGLAELYELDFQNYLGLGQSKEDKLKKDIMETFKQLNYKLDCLSNNNFIPKPSSHVTVNKKQNPITLEQKVPLTLWNGDVQPEQSKGKFQSNKQINNKAKRLKNKRISRQRKKQQIKKQVNRSIEYGGMTKYQAQARKKIVKNRKNTSANIKYSKSNSFFQSMNQSTKSKPNPNINKMKI